MENSETMTESLNLSEEVTEIQTEVLTEVITETTVITEQETFTTTTECQTSQLNGLNVERINNFAYLGSAFIIACLFWFVCKGLYRLFNIFF